MYISCVLFIPMCFVLSFTIFIDAVHSGRSGKDCRFLFLGLNQGCHPYAASSN